MENLNPFKGLESEALCPPHLKNELVAEIDLIRNAITLIEVYVGDLFGLASELVSLPQRTSNDQKPPL